MERPQLPLARDRIGSRPAAGAVAAWFRRQQRPLEAPGTSAGGFRFQVYALDLIGFGASDQPGWNPRRPLDNRLWALQSLAFIRRVIQQPAVLIGNSLGGLTALTAAVLDPAWVKAVVAAPLRIRP